MNCPNCGTTNLDNASICANCGRPLSTPSYTPPPPAPSSYTPPPPGGSFGGATAAPAQIPNYLWQSIVVTICCCLPFGIVGIIFAAQVNDKIRRGDIQGAMVASKNAKTWVLVAFIVGIVLQIVVWGLYSAAILSAIHSGQFNR